MSFGQIKRSYNAIATNTWTSEKFRDKVRLLWAHVVYTASATAGNRSITGLLLNGGQQDWDTPSNVSITAGQTKHIAYLPGAYRESAFVNDEIQIAFPRDFLLIANDQFKIYDVNDVDAADTMIITYRYEEV